MAATHISDDLTATVKKQLECPVCLNLATTPIYMCPNGHNVCSTCQAQLVQCPVCRWNGRPSNRNLFAEEMAQSAIVPCKNYEKGCTETMKVIAMVSHLKECKFNFKCLFEDCPWKGSVVDLADHARNVHGENYIEITESGVVLKILDVGSHDSMLRDQNRVKARLPRSTQQQRALQQAQLALQQQQLVHQQQMQQYPQYGAQPQKPFAASNNGTARYSTSMLLYKNHIFWYHTEVSEKSSFNVQLRLIGATGEDSMSAFSFRMEFLSANCARLTYINNILSIQSDDCYEKVFVDKLSNFNNSLSGGMLYRLKLLVGVSSKEVLPTNDTKETGFQLRTSKPEHGIW